MELTADELQRRAPLWEVLADFWLDTELADWQYEHIARVIVESAYSPAEVRAIHDFEVAPVVWRNLLCVAGGLERIRRCMAARRVPQERRAAQGAPAPSVVSYQAGLLPALSGGVLGRG